MKDAEFKKTCKNCNSESVELFCSHCGQKEAHRITSAHVSHDIIHVFLHADKGVFPFISRLIPSPGILAREYIDGKRKIFNPYQYFILSVGVVFYLTIKSGFYENLEAVNQGKGQSQVFRQALVDFNHFLRSHTNLIRYASLPLLALQSWLFFRKKGNNYAEHFTMLIFSISQVNTINALFLLIFILFKTTVYQSAGVTALLTLISLVMTYHQFFKIKLVTALGKSLLIYLTFYLAYTIILGSSVLTYYLLMKNSH